MLLHKYRYEGPVMIFDRLAANKWKGETTAVSEKKAMQNLSYQFKKEAKLRATAKVHLLGKIIKTETFSIDDASNMYY